MKTSTLTQKGQITIPKKYRDAFGWTQETDLAFIEEKNGVRIVTAEKRAEVLMERIKSVKWDGPSTEDLMSETRAEKLEDDTD